MNALAYKLHQQEYFTYADYEKWETDERFEVICGVAYAMAAPSFSHQTCSAEIARQFGNFLKGKKCNVVAAPFDVCLFGKGDKDTTVVQPDIVIVCDKSKLDDNKRLNGAPDMVIEILSPSSLNMDRVTKFMLYQRAGVREYWIVDPDSGVTETYILTDGRYIAAPYPSDAEIPVHILDGCVIDMKEVFPAPEAGEEQEQP